MHFLFVCCTYFQFAKSVHSFLVLNLRHYAKYGFIFFFTLILYDVLISVWNKFTALCRIHYVKQKNRSSSWQFMSTHMDDSSFEMTPCPYVTIQFETIERRSEELSECSTFKQHHQQQQQNAREQRRKWKKKDAAWLEKSRATIKNEHNMKNLLQNRPSVFHRCNFTSRIYGNHN